MNVVSTEGQKRVLDLWELELQATVSYLKGVLGTKLRSSVGTVCVPNC